MGAEALRQDLPLLQATAFPPRIRRYLQLKAHLESEHCRASVAARVATMQAMAALVEAMPHDEVVAVWELCR